MNIIKISFSIWLILISQLSFSDDNLTIVAVGKAEKDNEKLSFIFKNDSRLKPGENNQILHRMLNHDPKKGFYIVNLFGGKTLLSHEYLSSQLVDRHGNKFEKEVTK